MNLRRRIWTLLFLFLLLNRSLFYFGVHILLFFNLIWFWFILNLYFFHPFHNFINILLIFLINIHLNTFLKETRSNSHNINLWLFISLFKVYLQIIISFKCNLILIPIQIMKCICFDLREWFPYESMDEIDWWGCAAIEDSDLFFEDDL